MSINHYQLPLEPISEELMVLHVTYALLTERVNGLYANTQTVYTFLPTDPLTQAAFSALCGARRYISALAHKHVTGFTEPLS